MDAPGPHAPSGGGGRLRGGLPPGRRPRGRHSDTPAASRGLRLPARPPFRGYTLPLPAPFPAREGRAYLLLSPGGLDAAVVDPGPDSPEARQFLGEALAAAGLRPEALRWAILTDWQPQRAGILGWLCGRAGLTVVARGGVAGMAQAWARAADEAGALERAAKAGGFPPPLQARLAELTADRLSYRPRWQPTARQRWLSPKPGHRLQVAGQAWETRDQAQDRTGLQLWHPQSKVLVGGRLLLRAGRFRLPLAEGDGAWADRLPRLHRTWLELGRQAIDLILPSEGPPIRSHRLLIARRLALLRDQLAALELAAAGEALSPWELLQAVDEGPPEAADLPERLATLLALVTHLERVGRLRREGPAAAPRFRRVQGHR